MRHAKAAAVAGAIQATPDADTFLIQDGATTISGFDQALDRLLFVGNSYSDIIYFGDIHDGLAFDTFNGGAHFEVHALDVNGDGIIDTEITGSGSVVDLLSVDPSSLHPWNLMGG